MPMPQDAERRRYLTGLAPLGLAFLLILDALTRILNGDEWSTTAIAVSGFVAPLSMLFMIGTALGLMQLLRRRADLAGAIGATLMMLGFAAGIRIMALRQLEAALQNGVGGLAPDLFNRIFKAAPILWTSIVPTGILFPIGTITLGLTIVAKAPIPRAIGALLALGGVLFPIGRIGGVLWGVLSADVVLAAAYTLIAWQVLSRPELWTGEASAAEKERSVAIDRKVVAAFALLIFIALPARPQGPPFAAGLQLPSKVAFTRHHNLVVAEAGTPANNTGRISLIERATATRRTLIEGLPSGLSRAEEPGSPSGPSGVAVQDRIVYVTIGSGDAVLPGPAPGTEMRNPEVASPILASLLSLESSVALDASAGGFVLNAADHATLKSGQSVTLRNDAGESLVVRLVADFPDYTEEPRPDFPANVRAGNPFGVVAQGQTLYVVDASQNVVRRVDAATGATTMLTNTGKIPNPTPVGPPVIDSVPDSIQLRGNDLVVTTLTGFPFPPGSASVLKIDTTTGATSTLVAGLTSAIDVTPLGDGAQDPLLVLEFSTNMLQGAPGRLRLVTPGGASTTIAEGLPTPTSMAVDRSTGEIFVTHIFPGFITRIAAASMLPRAEPAAIVPVVASVAGAYGAHFTTSMQISNPYPFAIAGRMVVHPAGVAASASDPSTPYSLAPFATQTLDAVVAAGAGSLDVLGTAPVIVTTMTETTSMNRLQIPTIDPADAITSGILITPADPARQRFNIGIRTLGARANLKFTLRDSAGTTVATTTRALAPDFFQQFSFTELLGTTAGANQSLAIEATSGTAIVYGAAVDNITGAMTLQIAQ